MELQSSYNMATNSSTGHSPTYLNLSRELKTPGSLAHVVTAPEAEKRQNRIEKLHAALELSRAQMAKSFQNQQKHYNLSRRKWASEVGEKVLKKTHHLSSKAANFNAKLAERYEGPYTVVRKITSVIYDLKYQRGDTARRVRVKDLKTPPKRADVGSPQPPTGISTRSELEQPTTMSFDNEVSELERLLEADGLIKFRRMGPLYDIEEADTSDAAMIG